MHQLYLVVIMCAPLALDDLTHVLTKNDIHTQLKTQWQVHVLNTMLFDVLTQPMLCCGAVLHAGPLWLVFRDVIEGRRVRDPSGREGTVMHPLVSDYSKEDEVASVYYGKCHVPCAMYVCCCIKPCATAAHIVLFLL